MIRYWVFVESYRFVYILSAEFFFFLQLQLAVWSWRMDFVPTGSTEVLHMIYVWSTILSKKEQNEKLKMKQKKPKVSKETLYVLHSWRATKNANILY